MVHPEHRPRSGGGRGDGVCVIVGHGAGKDKAIKIKKSTRMMRFTVCHCAVGWVSSNPNKELPKRELCEEANGSRAKKLPKRDLCQEASQQELCPRSIPNRSTGDEFSIEPNPGGV